MNFGSYIRNGNDKNFVRGEGAVLYRCHPARYRERSIISNKFFRKKL